MKIGLALNSFLCCGLAVSGFMTLVFAYEVGPLHYTQQQAMIPGVISQLSSFLWAALSVWLNPKLGAWPAYSLGE